MVWGWLLGRYTRSDAETKRERATKREQELIASYDAILKVKNKQIKALESALLDFEDLAERGVMEAPKIQVREDASVVDMISSFIEGDSSIPKQVKPYVMGYLKKRAPEIDAFAGAFIDAKMAEITKSIGKGKKELTA